MNDYVLFFINELDIGRPLYLDLFPLDMDSHLVDKSSL